MSIHDNIDSPNHSWASALLDWFQAHRRDLPWRESPRDPYGVWVSEIMLQQTRVEAVKPYYENWMTRFPTLASLAEADEDEVLRQWQGLGYYSRVRNLHEAVQEVQKSYGGAVPQTLKEMKSLKGVGDYTAGAVLSIAYGKAVPAVDGNVLRIFSRLYGIEENILSPAVKKEVTALAETQIPHDRPGDFNEALMDFGATVCIPKNPRCEECPVVSYCQAHHDGKQHELPLRLRKKDIPTEKIAVLVVSYGHSWLIHRRPSKGLLAKMWEFPNAVMAGNGPDEVEALVHSLGVEWDHNVTFCGEVMHVFSHKRWHMMIYSVEAIEKTTIGKEDWQWLKRSDVTTVPWAGPHGKITAMV